MEIGEVLRLWLRGDMGLRPIAETAGVDRKTVGRYVEAAEAGWSATAVRKRLTDGCWARWSRRADGEPGQELHVDVGKMGMRWSPRRAGDGRSRGPAR